MMFKTIWSRVFALVAVIWLVVVLILAVQEYERKFKKYSPLPAYSPYSNVRVGFYKLCMASSSAEKYADWLYWGYFVTSLPRPYLDEKEDEKEIEYWEKRHIWMGEETLNFVEDLRIEAKKRFNLNLEAIKEDHYKYANERDFPLLGTLWWLEYKSMERYPLRNIITATDEMFYNDINDNYCTGDNRKWMWVIYRYPSYVWPVNIIEERIKIIGTFLFLFIIPLLFIYASYVWISKGFSRNRMLPDKIDTATTVSTLEDDAPRSEGSVADELLKWNELLAKGAITQEEYDKAKRDLLS